MGILRDHHHHHTHKAGDTTVTVNVPESNPADAARYADGALEEAKRRLLGTLTIVDNRLNIDGVFYEISPICREAELHTRFSLNGKVHEHQHRASLSHLEHGRSVQQDAELLIKMVDLVLDEVRQELIEEGINSLIKPIGRPR